MAEGGSMVEAIIKVEKKCWKSKAKAPWMAEG